MTAVAHATKPQGKSPPPEIDPWTHRVGGLIERYPRFWIGLGDRETRLMEERIEKVSVDRPIYIAGLARSGSTILLELLARHPDTASHRYRDFPLVLTPWLWNWFVDRAGNQQREAAERAHRDRIKVTPESPEAFEEVIWMAFFQDLHDASTGIAFDKNAHHPRFETFYRDHIRKLLALRGASRYLSKGNYNVTRLGYLKKLFPDARFVVPIRDPVWHVASLMKQHRLFASWESEDQRVRAHMRRSGHFEFGLDRRPANVGDGQAAAEIAQLWDDGDEVAGWAAHWASVYGYVASQLEDPELAAATLVVRYEDLCNNPAATLAAILDHCALADDGLTEAARAMISAPTYYEPSFTEADRQAISDRTGAVARLFGYD
ncbi:sulfotransferase family protein [Chelativorans salis]|uniref:Sulfotransferase n=1 Tax=Chelativorans salis TaxID=2978478 RepID=A0ABT2LJ30_9HYPH|nr:sulfotransferase [Chelativorans sp. EGI FJ00035]MCT7373693.1 sulfotransferase [Chelativorans sp. EGI FJ00035]